MKNATAPPAKARRLQSEHEELCSIREQATRRIAKQIYDSLTPVEQAALPGTFQLAKNPCLTHEQLVSRVDVEILLQGAIR